MVYLLIAIAFVISLYLLGSFANNNGGSLLIVYISVLPFYTTVLVLLYKFSGSYILVKIFQSFKEVFIILLLLNFILRTLYSGSLRVRLLPIDYLVASFFTLNLLYVLAPIGSSDVITKVLSARSNSMFVLLYLLGRLTILTNNQEKRVIVNLVAVGLLATIVSVIEKSLDSSLHEYSGYAQYMYDFYGFYPKGEFGLSDTFASSSGIRRFSAFFANPLELASSVLITAAAAYSLYLKKARRTIFIILLIGVLCSLVTAFSRASMVAVLIQFAFISIILKDAKLKKFLLSSSIIVLLVVLAYASNNLIELVIKTLAFQEASSLGHLLAWIEGIESMMQNPIGIGLGTSGVTATSQGVKSVGGENQFVIIGVQLGVIGLLLYLLILYNAIRYSLNSFNSNSGSTKWLCFIAATSKFGMLIPSFTSNIENYIFLVYVSWWLVGYAVQKTSYL